MNLNLDLKDILLHALLEEIEFYRRIGATDKNKREFILNRLDHIRDDHLDNREVVFDFILDKSISVTHPKTSETLDFKLLVEVGLPKPVNDFIYEVRINIPPELQLLENPNGTCGLNMCTYSPITFLNQYTCDVSQRITKDINGSIQVATKSMVILGTSDSGLITVNKRPVKYNPEILEELFITFQETDIDRFNVNSEYRNIVRSSVKEGQLKWKTNHN